VLNRTGNDRAIDVGQVRCRESFDPRLIGHRHDVDLSLLNGPMQLGCSRTAASLGDDLIHHVGNGRYARKAPLE
jgi:hypothetical protein